MPTNGGQNGWNDRFEGFGLQMDDLVCLGFFQYFRWPQCMKLGKHPQTIWLSNLPILQSFDSYYKELVNCNLSLLFVKHNLLIGRRLSWDIRYGRTGFHQTQQVHSPKCRVYCNDLQVHIGVVAALWTYWVSWEPVLHVQKNLLCVIRMEWMLVGLSYSD